eukprot:GHRR01012201.1.p1 GENE.GHRR01012201.1~~GHRR01012201.1.p1  ORF type:complete len:184 (+),score=48.01 GHRR01012201.1:239-790(+)
MAKGLKTAAQQPDRNMAHPPLKGGADSLKGQGSGPLSLLFSIDGECERLSSTTPTHAEYDPVLEVQHIRAACTLNEAGGKLAQAVHEAKVSSLAATGAIDLWYVGSYLRSKHGYLVSLRHANVSKRPKAYLRMLRHTYLVCKGVEGFQGGNTATAPSLAECSFAVADACKHHLSCNRSPTFIG